MQFRFNLAVPVTGLMMLAAGLGQSAGAPSAQAQNRTSQSVPGELLVRWKSQRAPLVLAPGTNPSRWQQSGLQAQLSDSVPGAQVKKVFAISGWSLIKIPAGQSGAAARAALIRSLGAANVVPNYRRYATRTPNDPAYGSQWQWPKIKAPDAWNTTVGNREVVVAVLDTGIDLNHADMQANLWKNTREIAGNGIDDDRNGYVDDVYGYDAIAPTTAPQDENGHGTHCAGLVGAVGNNASEITGVAWSVRVMALRFLDAEGSGSDADAIACFEYAIKMKQSGVNLKVISNSYAGPDDNPAFKESYQAVERAGILQVSAAGNDGENNDSTPQYPASYATATNLSVAATDQNDGLANFSNFGQSVDIAAPGVSILSLKLGGGTVFESGTSMATPIVAGAAALIASRETGLSAAALKTRLMATVDPISGLTGAVKSGGRLNLARAVLPVSYSLKGQVYRLDGSTKIALPGAIVSLSGQSSASVASATNGTYAFNNLAAGTYTLKVTLKNYTFNTVTSIFPVSGGANSKVIDFKATSVPSKFFTLFGVTRDAAGVPKSGVSIAINATPNVILAVTDSRGKYEIPNCAPGTYTLLARGGGNYKWTATPTRISVPQFAVNGRGELNFRGDLIDKSAPAITITTPADGGVFAPGNQVATGTATDATNNKEIYLQLTRFSGFVAEYYEWPTRQWVSSRTASTIITRPTGGKNTKWAMTLPSLIAANYSLRVWGRDSLGNVSKGEADAFASFGVAKPAASSRGSAATAPVPSGGSS